MVLPAQRRLERLRSRRRAHLHDLPILSKVFGTPQGLLPAQGHREADDVDKISLEHPHVLEAPPVQLFHLRLLRLALRPHLLPLLFSFEPLQPGGLCVNGEHSRSASATVQCSLVQAAASYSCCEGAEKLIRFLSYDRRQFGHRAGSESFAASSMTAAWLHSSQFQQCAMCVRVWRTENGPGSGGAGCPVLTMMPAPCTELEAALTRLKTLVSCIQRVAAQGAVFLSSFL